VSMFKSCWESSSNSNIFSSFYDFLRSMCA
jgi:hypothetical protein